MSELRLDWVMIAKDLAAHLAAAGDVQVIERMLVDAERDAQTLAAPEHFWRAVAVEYRARRGSDPEAARVHELILAKQGLSGKAAR